MWTMFFFSSFSLAKKDLKIFDHPLAVLLHSQQIYKILTAYQKCNVPRYPTALYCTRYPTTLRVRTTSIY